jgi:hypothetical protein
MERLRCCRVRERRALAAADAIERFELAIREVDDGAHGVIIARHHCTPSRLYA